MLGFLFIMVGVLMVLLNVVALIGYITDKIFGNRNRRIKREYVRNEFIRLGYSGEQLERRLAKEYKLYGLEQ